MKRLATAVLVLMALTGTARAGDGSLTWWTLETEHFTVHYYDPHEDVARRVAVVAERAHRILAPALGHEPKERTHIVVSDDTDGANGFASVLPRNVIHVYATAPGSMSTLNDHDDWLYGLVAHEYAHILHLDTISGIPAWYNRVFGKIWAPNQIQPRWFIEGLATYEESKRSSSGRIRNTIFDMFLRISVLYDKELDLDAVSTGPLAWPHGTAAYLYGSHFVAYVADRYGDDKLAAISVDFGRQPIPFGLNRAVRRAIGKTWVELYEEWREEMRRRYRLQREAVEKRGLRVGRKLTRGEANSLPRYTVDGKQIVWASSDGYSRAEYRVMPSGGDAGDSRRFAQIDGAGHISFLPDGTGMILEVGVTFRTNYAYTDLYRYDFATRALTRLTRGLRVGDPEVSPDGRRAAFTVNASGKFRLATMDLVDDPTAVVVWEGEGRFDQAYAPNWSPDGKQLAFSAWTRGGYRDVWIYDVDGGTAAPIFRDRAVDADPVWSPDGRYVYFISDRTGIYNVYAWEVATGALRQVTNVLGGTFGVDVSPDGKRLAYSGFDEEGYEIYELALDESTWLEPEAYVNDRPDSTDIADDEVVVSGPRPYRPLETLAPYSYQLTLGADAFGTALTVLTGGSDVAGFHAWSLGATYGLERGDVSVAAAWSYGRLWPSFRLAVGRGIGRPGGLYIDGRNTRYTEERWAASAAMGLPVLRDPGFSADLSFIYSVDWLRNVSPDPTLDPNTAVPQLPETGVIAGLTTRLSLSSVRRYRYSVGPAEGRSISLAMRVNHEALGSEFQALELSYRWDEYLPMPWRGNQTLSLRLSGGIITTDRRRDGSYALGGAGQQDLVDAVVNSRRVSSSWFRGYAPGALRGRQYHLLNAEYRVPVFTIEKGLDTMPIYVRRLHLAALFDAGNAFYDDLDPTEFKLAVGGAIRLDVVFGWYMPGTFDLGYARGLSEGGVGEYWLYLTGTV